VSFETVCQDCWNLSLVKMASPSNPSDLLIRETILGVIKSRDLNREGIIHTSDFRAAVADLGFPFGHPIVENILVHCVINSDGFVDFKGLERELARLVSPALLGLISPLPHAENAEW
jgi:hypothetical protein